MKVKNERGSLVRMLVRPTVKRDMGVYWRSDAELTPGASAFLQYMQAFVRSNRGLPDEAADVANR